MVEVERALAAEDVTLEHSLMMCPILPQNRQRFCSKQLCLHELAVFSELRGKVRIGLLLVSIATASISVTGVTGVTLSAVIIFIPIGILSGVCFFIALPFIIRTFILVGGWIFSGHLRMTLPILGVDRLGEGMEFMEGVRFANTGDFILDVGWKSAIHLLAEGDVTPLDTGSKVVEVD